MAPVRQKYFIVEVETIFICWEKRDRESERVRLTVTSAVLSGDKTWNQSSSPLPPPPPPLTSDSPPVAADPPPSQSEWDTAVLSCTSLSSRFILHNGAQFSPHLATPQWQASKNIQCFIQRKSEKKKNCTCKYQISLWYCFSSCLNIYFWNILFVLRDFRFPI